MENKSKFNASQDFLIIDDSYKTMIIGMTILFITNIIVSIINLYITHFYLTNGLSIIHTLTGSTSLIALIWFWLNRIIDKQIPFKNISYLKTRNILGAQRFTIILKNGKRRDINLDRKHYFKELESLKQILTEKNIPTL